MNRGKRGISLGTIIAIAIVITIIWTVIASVTKSKIDNLSIAGNASNSNASSSTNEIKVGDYIEYTPKITNDLSDNGYTLETKYYGGSINQTVRAETLEWRVLNVNSNGTIDLISTANTSNTVTLTSAQGYNNGVYLLNDICNKLYSNSAIGATARSLNVSDIQKYIKDASIYNSYSNYGTTKNFSTKTYPLQWKSNDDTKLIEPGSTYGTATETNRLTATGTYWSAETSNATFNTAKTAVSDSDSNIYYNLFKSGNYWLASRYVNIDDYAGAWFRDVSQ